MWQRHFNVMGQTKPQVLITICKDKILVQTRTENNKGPFSRSKLFLFVLLLANIFTGLDYNSVFIYFFKMHNIYVHLNDVLLYLTCLTNSSLILTSFKKLYKSQNVTISLGSECTTGEWDPFIVPILFVIDVKCRTCGLISQEWRLRSTVVVTLHFISVILWKHIVNSTRLQVYARIHFALLQ